MSLQTFGLLTFGLNTFLVDSLAGATPSGPPAPPDDAQHLGTYAPATFSALTTFRLGTFSGGGQAVAVGALIPPLRARSALTPLSAAHNIVDDSLRARTVQQ